MAQKAFKTLPLSATFGADAASANRLQWAVLGGIIRVREKSGFAGDDGVVVRAGSSSVRGGMTRGVVCTNDRGGPMAVDKFNFPQMFFLSETFHGRDVWEPRADVYRTPDGWLVKLELAGVRLDEIRLATEGPQADRGRDPARRALPRRGWAVTAWRLLTASFERALELPGLSEACRDRDVLRRRHATGTDQDGGSIVTSENQMIVEAKPESLGSLPVLPLKNSVLFPHLFMPLSAGRPASLAAVEAILATEEKTFLAVALRNPEAESADGRRPLHRRHPGRHQEDGPLADRDRAIGSGRGARDAGRARADRALSEGESPAAAVAGRHREPRSRPSAARSSN